MEDRSTSKIQAIKDADALRFMASVWASGRKVLACFNGENSTSNSWEMEIVGYKQIKGLHYWILANDHLVPFVDLKEYKIESAYFKVDQTNES